MIKMLTKCFIMLHKTSSTSHKIHNLKIHYCNAPSSFHHCLLLVEVALYKPLQMSLAN